MKVLLIDGDILVYQAACAAEVPIHWGEDLWTLHSYEEPARAQLDDQIKSLKDTLKADKVILALTTTEVNFRKTVYPAYKSNRNAVRKPLVWKPLREYVHATYETFERPGLEADDCLGILLTRPFNADKEDRILVSEDKDMRTLPGKHYNPGKRELFEVSQSEADWKHMVQTLTGDATDGYPGCPGIGPKSAEKIVDQTKEPSTWWPAVVATYKKAGLTEEFALQMARCARILRASDYDFKTKKPILWVPPKENA